MLVLLLKARSLLTQQIRNKVAHCLALPAKTRLQISLMQKGHRNLFILTQVVLLDSRA